MGFPTAFSASRLKEIMRGELIALAFVVDCASDLQYEKQKADHAYPQIGQAGHSALHRLDTITARKQGNSRLTGLSTVRCHLCNNFLMKIIERWLLFRYVQGEFTQLSKPFKTKAAAEKERLKLPERERREAAVGVIRSKK